MLNKNKKLKGKPWGGRGRGRGGEQGMEDMAQVCELNISLHSPTAGLNCTVN